MNSVLIEEENFEKARKEIRRNRGKRIIFSSRNDETARKILEKEEINVLLIRQKARKDRQKQRDSGLDSVMARIARKKDVIIGIDYDEMINTEGKEKAMILSRIRQNIKLCNKERLGMTFISSLKNRKNEHDLRALGLSLGMPTSMIKDL